MCSAASVSIVRSQSGYQGTRQSSEDCMPARVHLKSPCEMRVTLGSESSAGMWLCSQAMRAIISGIGSLGSCDLYCCAHRHTSKHQRLELHNVNTRRAANTAMIP